MVGTERGCQLALEAGLGITSRKCFAHPVWVPELQRIGELVVASGEKEPQRIAQDVAAKRVFLDLANIWWWESNRTIPINIFLKGDWDQFRPYVRTFTNRDLVILHGPVCSLAEMSRRRSKRKSITLVRRLD